MAAKTIDVTKHVLVPKHEKVSEKEKKDLEKKFSLQSFRELPRILPSDPAIQDLDLKEDDVVKVTRKSLTAGTMTFYRRVANV